MKKVFLFSCFFSLLFFQVNGVFSQSDAAQRILFIFDASGSMWQKIGNSTRIQVAKKTMETLSQKISNSAQVGLIAYGHNNNADCNDIETLIPLTEYNQAQFASKINALNPKGKTPIAKSINQALALIRGINDPVTIILVSDGLETCEGNACETIKNARAAGVKITMHVVGFGISEKDLSPLECIAQAGGGQYFGASNAEELAMALDKTLEQAPAGDAFLSLKASLDGKLLDVAIKIFKKGETKETKLGRTYESESTNPRIFQLEPGTYTAEVTAINIRSSPMQVLTDLVVKSSDTLSREVIFDQGIAEVKVTRNGELSDATINFFQAGTKQRVTGSRSYNTAKTNPVSFKLPPGKYDIEIKGIEINSGPIVRIEEVEVNGGSTKQFSHDFQSGKVSIGAQKGTELVDATINIFDTKTGRNVAAGRSYQSASSNPKKFVLEPGQYRVEIGPLKPPGLTKKTITIEVTAKGSIEKIATW